MYLLLETASGYGLFRVLKKSILKEDNIFEKFMTASGAQDVVKLRAFEKFDNNSDALLACSSLIENKIPKSLKNFLQKKFIAKHKDEKLIVSDPKLGKQLKSKLAINAIYSEAVIDLLKGIRNNLDVFIGDDVNIDQSRLGLAHSLSRYHLKFSAEKIDTMIIQAIGLLDDLDKEVNTYGMRAREWYGWHFPELTKILVDNVVYAKVVRSLGLSKNAAEFDFSDLLDEEKAAEVREAAKVSTGTEISENDVKNVMALCDQIIEMSTYRTTLFEYIRNRMKAIAPNLTILVGELVGARLIAHAGSLLNLAKHPASTVQILGAEKALFRALRTKHETPKYGLIFHASLVGQSSPRNKGKISRTLAAKSSLAARVDALGEKGQLIGHEQRMKVERRLEELEGKQLFSGQAKGAQMDAKAHTPSGQKRTYSSGTDVVMEKKAKKQKVATTPKKVAEEMDVETPAPKSEKVKKSKKKKKEKTAKKEKTKKSKEKKPKKAKQEKKSKDK